MTDIDLVYDGLCGLADNSKNSISCTKEKDPSLFMELDGFDLLCERGGKWVFYGFSNHNRYRRFYLSLYHDWCNDPAPMTTCGHNFCFSVYNGKVLDLSAHNYDSDQPKLQKLFIEKACATTGKSAEQLCRLGRKYRKKKQQGVAK